MKQPDDDKTLELPLPRKPGRTKMYATAYEKVKAFRERHGLVTFSVDLPIDVVQGLNDYLKFKNVTKTEVLTRLIRGQLLRKR